MENTNKTPRKMWEMINDGDSAALAAHTKTLNERLEQRIEAARLAVEAREIAEGSGPIAETEWLGGTKYRIAGVRHGVMPVQRDFTSYEEMMVAFREANA